MSKHRSTCGASGKHYRAARNNRPCAAPALPSQKFIAFAVLFAVLVFVKGIIIGYFLRR